MKDGHHDIKQKGFGPGLGLGVALVAAGVEVIQVNNHHITLLAGGTTFLLGLLDGGGTGNAAHGWRNAVGVEAAKAKGGGRGRDDLKEVNLIVGRIIFLAKGSGSNIGLRDLGWLVAVAFHHDLVAWMGGGMRVGGGS